MAVDEHYLVHVHRELVHRAIQDSSSGDELARLERQLRLLYLTHGERYPECPMDESPRELGLLRELALLAVALGAVLAGLLMAALVVRVAACP